MTLSMASIYLAGLWITSGLLATIAALNTKMSFHGSSVWYIGSDEPAVGTHLILLLQLVMIFVSFVMCVKLYRHRRRVIPVQVGVTIRFTSQIYSLHLSASKFLKDH